MSLRILNLLNSSHRRGAEAFAMDLGSALTEAGASVHSVALVGGPPGSTHEIEVLGRGRGASAKAMARLLQSSREVDVVLGHGGRTLTAGAIARRLGGRPFVYRVIGEPMTWSGGSGSIRRKRVTLALRQADAIVGYFAAQTGTLVQNCGASTARTHVIPKGIDLGSFAPPTPEQRARERARLGLDGPGPVVAYVGALTLQKNVEQVIRSVASVPDARLLVAGSGPHEPKLRRVVEELGSTVKFTGALSDPRAVYAAADVLVLTSRTEGVPTVLLEAALMGLPVVASRVGGIPDTVLEGTTGLLVELDDCAGTSSAISAAIDRRLALGAAAREHALATWDIKSVAQQWLQLFHGLIEAPRSS